MRRGATKSEGRRERNQREIIFPRCYKLEFGGIVANRDQLALVRNRLWRTQGQQRCVSEARECFCAPFQPLEALCRIYHSRPTSTGVGSVVEDSGTPGIAFLKLEDASVLPSKALCARGTYG